MPQPKLYLYLMTKFERHISITDDTVSITDTLEELCQEFSLSKTKLKAAISKGILWLTRGNKTERVRNLKRALKKGDSLHIYYNENILEQTPTEAILIEDLQDYSIWYKPYGMLCQGSKWSDHCTINRWVETHLIPQRPAFIVHRLDRAASGLIIIAHSRKAAKAFSQMFEARQLDKNYHIISHGQFTAEEKQIEINSDIDGKKAKSTFIPISYNEKHNISLINVKIETGRKHQIRIHAASIGKPVVGDRLHGKELSYSDEINLQLCAVKLNFTCPISQQNKQFELPTQLKPSLDRLVEKLF